jgi:hypothetical protein
MSNKMNNYVECCMQQAARLTITLFIIVTKNSCFTNFFHYMLCVPLASIGEAYCALKSAVTLSIVKPNNNQCIINPIIYFTGPA